MLNLPSSNQRPFVLFPCGFVLCFPSSYSVWQDKAEKQTKDDSPGKGRRVSGLASLMAYEGDSDDDESTW